MSETATLTRPPSTTRIPTPGPDAETGLETALFSHISLIQQPLWVQRLLVHAQGELIGIARSSVPEEWMPSMRQWSVPLAPKGPQWDDCFVLGDETFGLLPDGRCGIPADPGELVTANAVQLKPVRSWIGERFDVQLQGALGLRTFLWSNQAVVVSTLPVVLAGFLHLLSRKQRQVLNWRPYEAVLVRW